MLRLAHENAINKEVGFHAFNTLRLSHFSQMSHFYTPGFLTFSNGIEMEYCTEMG